MASFNLGPDPLQGTWFIPGGNTPASGGQLFSYVAGSSTKTTLYKDNAGGSSWTNPIVLDSGGNLPSGGQIWIPAGVTIDVVFAPANDVDPPQSPYRTLQDIDGINDVSSAVSEWVTGPAPTYVSGTQFVVQGDQTTTLKNGRRLRSTNTGGTIYGRITSVTASAGSTTINTVSDTGSLDSGLSAISYGLLDPQNTSIDEYHVFKDGGSVASLGNGTTNIWGVSGSSVHITGTNTIHHFSSAAYAGAERTIIFDGAVTLQTSAAFLSAPYGNITTQAGDRARLLASTTTHGVITQYQRADGGPVSKQAVVGTGRNFSGRRASASTVTFAADEVLLKDTSGGAFLASTVSLVANATVAGANGLDTGTLSSSIWYYDYVIAQQNGSTAALLSASSTTPSMPAGYTYKALVSAVRADATSSFIAYNQRGSWQYYDTGQSVLTGGSASVETAISIATAVPPIAQAFKAYAFGNAASDGVGNIDSVISLRTVSGSDQAQIEFAQAPSTVIGFASENEFPAASSQTFFYLFSPTTNVASISINVKVKGFKMPNGGQ